MASKFLLWKIGSDSFKILSLKFLTIPILTWIECAKLTFTYLSEKAIFYINQVSQYRLFVFLTKISRKLNSLLISTSCINFNLIWYLFIKLTNIFNLFLLITKKVSSTYLT